MLCVGQASALARLDASRSKAEVLILKATMYLTLRIGFGFSFILIPLWPLLALPQREPHAGIPMWREP